MQIQSAAQSQSAKIQQAKHWLSQLHAGRPPLPPPAPPKAAQATHMAGKHAVASAFSAHTVRPGLHIVINDKGTKVLNRNLGFSAACTAGPCGDIVKITVSPPPWSPGLWGADCLGKLQESLVPSSSRWGLNADSTVLFPNPASSPWPLRMLRFEAQGKVKPMKVKPRGGEPRAPGSQHALQAICPWPLRAPDEGSTGTLQKRGSTGPILRNHGVQKRVQDQDSKKRDSKESIWYKQPSF